MARIIAAIIATQICANSWWYYATMTNDKESPVIIVAILSSIGICVSTIAWILSAWND